MTWLTKLRTYLGHDKLPVGIDYNVNTNEATEAIQKASAALNDARQRRDESRQVTATLAFMNNRNHYGESVMLAMMPREKRS